jgi:hypothetical protein
MTDLLGPLEDQTCPSLAVVSLRECPRITNGTFEQVSFFFFNPYIYLTINHQNAKVVLPRCPNLQAFHYSESSGAGRVTEIDLYALSFLRGCNYVFPIRTGKLPALLCQIRDQLLDEAANNFDPNKVTPIQIKLIKIALNK